MECLAAIEQRRSVRDFLPQPITKERLTELVRAAVQAPSAMDEQPWHFTVITDRRLLSKISDSAKAQLLASSAEGSHIDHIREMLSDSKFNIFYNAGVLIVISAPRDLQWAVEDCALAAENLMLAAHSMGLGTCWIGFAQNWLGTQEGRAAIDLDPALLPVAPVIVGVPKSIPSHERRREPRIRWLG